MRNAPHIMSRPLDNAALAALKREFGVELPKHHVEVLRSKNGIEAYGGYYRLFGIATTEGIDLLRWNDPETWKFAWPADRKVLDYLCFAESAWGHQYAYRFDQLKKNPEKAPVHELDGLTMEATQFESDFKAFWKNEFERVAKSPYDSMTISTRGRLGDLGPFEHVALAPPLLLGGAEDPANAMKIPAVVGMVANGDLASQLTRENDDRQVDELEAYTDAKGRARLRVKWRDQ